MDPELQLDLAELTKSLHSENLSTRNRLLSIVRDSKFVNNVKEKYYPDIPMIPNDRCGRWYVDPKYYLEQKLEPSYFKSTDGHTNNWSFSTRRLNLHLLPQIKENNGIIIVDSTRRGKKIPDSFSKTVPIWISILNKIIFPEKPFSETFFTPLDTVSKYEHERILHLLPGFYEGINNYKDLIEEGILSFDENRKKFFKPFWIYPGCKKYPIFTGTEEYIPIILISASEQSQDGENKMFGFTYVQGAGDDHELWSRGLEPKLFWQNKFQTIGLANMSDAVVNELVDSIVLNNRIQVGELDDNEKFWSSSDIVKVTNLLYFGKIGKNITFKENNNIDLGFDKIIVLDSTFEFQRTDKERDACKIFKFDIDSGSKKSSKLLRTMLPNIMELLKFDNEKILILCNSGEDLSVAIVLCYLSLNFDENWIVSKDKKFAISKESIRRNLIKIIELRKVNPQRATLNSVNSFLMS